MLKICGYELQPGEKKQVTLHPVDNYDMPATLIAGAKEGKTLLITAGIHSGEYPGIPAVIRTAAEIDPGKLSGNLIMIHCVNTSGFWARTDCLLPEDNGNLNGDYPGDPNGTTTARIANYFVTELFPHADFVLDLHSGSQQEPLTECLFFPKWEEVREESLNAAKALDIPYLIQSMATSGEYSYAAHTMHIPALLLERGHSGFCESEWVDGYQKDLHLLIKHFDMYPFKDESTREKHVFVKTIYQEADEDGLWYYLVKTDDYVKKGQLLGRVEDFFGNVLHEYYAEEDGIVFYHCSGLSVKKGRNLIAYGIETSCCDFLHNHH